MIEEIFVRALNDIFLYSQLAIDLIDNLFLASHDPDTIHKLGDLKQQFLDNLAIAEAELSQFHLEPPKDRLLPKWWTTAQLDYQLLTDDQYRRLTEEIIQGAEADLALMDRYLKQIDHGFDGVPLFDQGHFALGTMDVTWWRPHL